MANTIIRGGWLDGHLIRRKARKPAQCDGWIGSVATGHRCKHIIQTGELFAEGGASDAPRSYWANDRFCLDCAGEEAQQAAAEHPNAFTVRRAALSETLQPA